MAGFPQAKQNIANQKCLILADDCRKALSDFGDSVDLIVTSPPYADARKGHYDSIHPDDFSEWFRTFHEPFWKALKTSGSLIINIKDKIVDGVRHRYVWRTIELLSSLGWQCIDDYIWHKTNPMPGFWPTRLRDGWEYCFHLSKTKHPFINQNAVRIPIGDWVKVRLANPGQRDLARHNSENNSGFGRDLSKWIGQDTVLPTNVIAAALVGKNKGHPAVFPPSLPAFFIKLLCPTEGLVVDPFAGSGTTGIAALQLGRDCVLIDNNVLYCETAYRNLIEHNRAGEYAIELIKPPADESGVKYRETSPVQLLLVKDHAVKFGRENASGAKTRGRKSRRKHISS